MTYFYRIAQMNESDARKICTWKYPGELSVYNFSDWDECIKKGYDIADSSKREKSYYSVYKDNDLLAFIHITERDDFVEIGLGMKPEECGKHYGKDVLLAGVTKSKEQFPGKRICLTVLTWNKRAVRCYESAGFRIVDKFFAETAYCPGERFLMEYSGE